MACTQPLVYPRRLLAQFSTVKRACASMRALPRRLVKVTVTEPNVLRIPIDPQGFPALDQGRKADADRSRLFVGPTG